VLRGLLAVGTGGLLIGVVYAYLQWGVAARRTVEHLQAAHSRGDLEHVRSFYCDEVRVIGTDIRLTSDKCAREGFADRLRTHLVVSIDPLDPFARYVYVCDPNPYHSFFLRLTPRGIRWKVEAALVAGGCCPSLEEQRLWETLESCPGD